MFITTSSFAKSAVEWASHYPHATLVLIDGKRLTELMVQYDLGVSTERACRIKRLDVDYFEDERRSLKPSLWEDGDRIHIDEVISRLELRRVYSSNPAYRRGCHEVDRHRVCFSLRLRSVA